MAEQVKTSRLGMGLSGLLDRIPGRKPKGDVVGLISGQSASPASVKNDWSLSRVQEALSGMSKEDERALIAQLTPEEARAFAIRTQAGGRVITNESALGETVRPISASPAQAADRLADATVTHRSVPHAEPMIHGGMPHVSGHGQNVRFDPTPVSTPKPKRHRPQLHGKELDTLLGHEGLADRGAIQEARARQLAEEPGWQARAKAGFAKMEEGLAADKAGGFFTKLASHVGRNRLKYIGGVGAAAVAAIAMNGGKKQEAEIDRAAASTEASR